MNTFRGILKRPETETGAFDPGAYVFPALDMERIKKELDLVAEGRRRGEKNLPAADSEGFDDVERRIVDRIGTEQRQRQKLFAARLETFQQRIAKLDLEHEAINMSAAAQRASTEFTVKVDEGKAALFNLWRNVCMIEDQWNEFRKTHKLIHPADYPLSRLWNFSIILAILVAESILNGNFLARGLETGLIGGVIEAFVISAINVTFGFFLGDCVVRYLFHRNYLMRFLAVIEIPISCGLSICFNLLVGHYRDALGGSDPVHASSEALNSFAMNPFSLASFESWILFALGLFFSTVAAIDGFKMDDPYPGYGKITRKHEQITRDYTDEKAYVVDSLTHTRDQALDAIHDARRNLAARRTELAGLFEQREKLARAYEAQQDELNRAANELLSAYRGANRSARTAPEPASFSARYELPGMPAPFSDSGEKSFDGEIEKIDAALQKAINQVNMKFEEAVGAFHQVGEFTNRDSHAVRTSAA